MKKGLALLFALLALVLELRIASAQGPGQPSFEVGVLGGPSVTTYFPGMIELFARIDNPTGVAIKGEVLVHARGGEADQPSARAAFTVASGGVTMVKLPMAASQLLELEVRVDDTIVLTRQFPADLEPALRIFDASDPSRVRTMVENASVGVIPSGNPYDSSSRSDARIQVASPYVDGVTGVPVLPSYVASWHGFHVLFFPSSVLTQLSAEELEPIAGHVLAGGTLAISISKPEDLRHPALSMWLAGDAEPSSATDANFVHFAHPLLATPQKTIPTVGDRPPELLSLSSYQGGNLRPSVFGASAPYGLGEVILLGFDPNARAVADEPWAHVRLAELARRAYERKRSAVIRPGAPAGRAALYGPRRGGGTYDPVINLLDPNRTARWAVGVASLLLCLYAVLAGPLSFNWAKKQNKPLYALYALPALSLITFLVLLIFGFASKGVSSRANHLTVIDAGAGMSDGTGRRFRAFFSPNAQSIDVRASARTSMLELADDEPTAYAFEADGEGVRILGVAAMPAQNVVIREDGILPLGRGVSITHGAESGEIVVTNRTGRDMSALVVKLSDDSFRYVGQLIAGASISSRDMSRGGTRFATWGRTSMTAGGPAKANDFDAQGLGYALQEEGEKVAGEAWSAVQRTAPSGVRWFPSGVPVLLAQMEGGSGTKRDSGVSVERDIIVVRVVGWGGEGP